MEQRRYWVLAAVVCVGAGIAVGEFSAALISPLLSPVTAVGQAVIDWVPGSLKTFIINIFGTGDKTVFLISMVVVMALLAAGIGLLERWRTGFGLAGIGLFGAIGITAVATRADATGPAYVSPIIAAIAAMLFLSAVANRFLRTAAVVPVAPHIEMDDGGSSPVARTVPPGSSPASDQRPPAKGSGPSRRRFLQVMTVGGVVAVVAAGAATALRNAAVVVTDLRAKVRLPKPATPAPAVPASATLNIGGITPLVTANKDFYRIDTALVVPAVNSDSWKLTVTGMVDRQVEIDFAELLAKPMVEHYTTIGCVSNEVGGNLVGNARWLGWPVRELLAMAGVQSGADMILSTSTDGFTAGTPLAAMLDERDAIIAVGMNGQPLPLEHGYPARLIVPGLYGYVSATKWLANLKVTTFAQDQGYWTPRGWSPMGPIKTASRIDVPASGSQSRAGTVMTAGVAWAPERGIKGVQVQLDSGPWQDAVLATAINEDTWVQWEAPLTIGAGSHVVQVRAIDGTGAVQTGASAPPAPNGATGWDSVQFTVV